MPPPTIRASHEQLYKQAFDGVIEHYQELKHSSISELRSMDYSKMEQSRLNNANVVRANKTEFICDVELAVRKALEEDPELAAVFTEVYIDLKREPDTSSPEIDAIRVKVGRTFTNRRLYPVAGYFKPKHIDRSKVIRKTR